MAIINYYWYSKKELILDNPQPSILTQKIIKDLYVDANFYIFCFVKDKGSSTILFGSRWLIQCLIKQKTQPSKCETF
jgi:hypothetical protein